MRSPLLPLGLAGLLVVACVGTASPTTSGTPAGPRLDGSPPATAVTLPATVDGLSVLSVEAAIGAHSAGAFPDDSLLAVGGWLERTLPMGCPYDPSNPTPAALERVCGWMDYVLARDPQTLASTTVQGSSSMTSGHEPTGPYLAPRESEGAVLNQAEFDHPPSSNDGYGPRAAIIVGHFHDPRAVLCPAAARATCDGEFVADHVAWFDGRQLGPTFWVGGDATGQSLHPRLDADGVLTAARAMAPGSSIVVWISAVRAADIGVVNPRPHLSVPPDAVVWYVRYALPGSAAATPGPITTGDRSSSASSGWLILDDASGSVLLRSP